MTAKTEFEKLGQGVGFERIRRITGYLVGTMDTWNDARRAEARDRVKHGMGKDASSGRYCRRQHRRWPRYPNHCFCPGLSPSLSRLPQSRNLGF